MLFSSSKPGSGLINHPLCVRCHVCDLHGAPWWGRGGGHSSAYLQTQVWLPAPRVGMSTRADWRNGGEERSVRGAEDGGAEVMTSAKWKTGTMGSKKKRKKKKQKRKTNLSSGSGLRTWEKHAENLKEHKSIYCTRPAHCVNSCLSPFKRPTK